MTSERIYVSSQQRSHGLALSSSAIEYLRSLHSIRLSQLAHLQHLREAALSRFPPSEHDALRLHPQLVETTIVREPKLPSLSQFMKQYEAKVAVGQFLGKGGKKGKAMSREESEKDDLAALGAEMGAEAGGATDGEIIDSGMTHQTHGEEASTSAVHPGVTDNALEQTSPAESNAPIEIQRSAPVQQSVVVNWEGAWNGGQVIDDEEEADNAAHVHA